MVQAASVPAADANVAGFIYRVVVVTLAIVVIGGLAGLFFLAYNGKTVPEAVVALPSAAVGAMAGLLAPSPASRR